MSGKTFFILHAITLVIIFVSTLTREIGRQFLKVNVNDLSLSFQLLHMMLVFES